MSNPAMVESDANDKKSEPNNTNSSSSSSSSEKKNKGTESKEEESEKQKKANRERNANWPLKGIKEPHDNDVLFGRGGGTNHHVGNKRYRKMVEGRKVDYVNSKRLDKPLVALEIIRNWRAQDPPGRFLKLDDASGLWDDVGDKKAREKTSQALREKAPLLRQQQKEDDKEEANDPNNNSNENNDQSSSSSPTTTTTTKQISFDKGTGKNKKEGRKISRAVLARDHSLGRDYLDPKESVTVKGFSWNEPLEKEDSASSSTQPPPPRYTQSRQEGWDDASFVVRGSGSPGNSRSAPPSRENYSVTSGNRDHSFAKYPLREASVSGPAHPWSEDEWDNASGGRPPPPASSDYNHVHPHSSFGDHSREYSRTRSREYSNHMYSRHPPDAYNHHEGEDASSSRRKQKMLVGSTDYEKLADMMGHDDRHNYRDHQRSYPSDNNATNNDGFANDMDPDYKYDQQQQQQHHDKRRYNNPDHYHSTTSRPSSSRQQHYSPPKYERRMYDARYNYNSYSEPGYNHSRHNDAYTDYSRRMRDRSSSPDKNNNNTSPARHGHDYKLTNNIPRPQIVKRETSHQNENVETKRNVKRGMFRRDDVSSDDKEPSYSSPFGGADDDMKVLEKTMGQSTLGTPQLSKELSKRDNAKKTDGRYIEKPKNLTLSERMNTVDAVRLEFTTGTVVDNNVLRKPPPMEKRNRMSTVDQIVLELENESSKLIDHHKTNKPSTIGSKDRLTTEDALAFAMADDDRKPSRPSAIGPKDRFTTEDAIAYAMADDDTKPSRPSAIGSKDRLTTEDAIAFAMGDDDTKPSRPSAIGSKDRLTTEDAIAFAMGDDGHIIKGSSKYSVETRESTFGSMMSEDSMGKKSSTYSVEKSESTFGSIAEGVLKSTKYTVDNRESTFGSLDIDLDAPEKLWGEE